LILLIFSQFYREFILTPNFHLYSAIKIAGPSRILFGVTGNEGVGELVITSIQKYFPLRQITIRRKRKILKALACEKCTFG